MVTTPQAVALADAKKAVNMFKLESINVPVLGIVENMLVFSPKELPENKYYIFGKDGGKDLANTLEVPLLGQIPLVQSVRESGDAVGLLYCNKELLPKKLLWICVKMLFIE